MGRPPDRTWTDVELTELLDSYFGERLSAGQLERLVADVSAGLSDKHARRGAFAAAAADSQGDLS